MNEATTNTGLNHIAVYDDELWMILSLLNPKSLPLMYEGDPLLEKRWRETEDEKAKLYVMLAKVNAEVTKAYELNRNQLREKWEQKKDSQLK